MACTFVTPIRLVISDIDGTFVRSDKTLSDQVVAAARRVIGAGARMTLISARPPSGIGWIAKRVGLDCALGAFNGGTIFRTDGTVLAAYHMVPEVAKMTLDLIDVPCVTPWLFADAKWYAKTLEGQHVPREIKSAGVNPIIVGDFGALLARVDKIVAVSDDHERLAAIASIVADALGSRATVSRSQPYYLDITAPRANKGDGVIALAETFTVPLDQVAVLGDQNNDLPMFAVAGLSVAMGQAPINVRLAADHVAQSNDDDGVADAINHIILPRIVNPEKVAS